MNSLKSQFTSTLTKAKYIYPYLEDVVLGIPYAFTISPDQQYHIDAPRYVQFYNNVRDNILPLLTGQYKLYLELSHKSQNLHYHGYLIFNNYRQVFLFYNNMESLKELCSFTIIKVTTYDWAVYCVKQRHVMKPNCHLFDIPYSISSKKYQLHQKIKKAIRKNTFGAILT